MPVLVALFAAAPALGHGFTNDDEILIVANRYLREPGALRQALTQDYFARWSGEPVGAIGYWRPLTKLSFALEYRVFGPHPAGFHLVSLLWFLGAVVAVHRLASALGLSAPASLAAATLFAAHPAHAESTALIAARSDLAAAAGLLACTSAYLRWRSTRHAAWLVAALGCEVLALASKELGVLAPLLLAAAALGRSARGEPRERAGLRSVIHSWVHLWPFLVPLALYAAARVALGIAPEPSPGGPGLLAATVAAGKLFVAGLLRTFAPLAWTPYLHEERPAASAAEALRWLLPAVLLAASAAWVAVRRPRLRADLALLALPILLIVATQPFVRVTSDPRALVFADRWLLLPAAGAALLWARLLAALARRLRGRAPRLGLGALHAALVAVLVVDAARENASYATNNSRLLHVADALSAKREPTPRQREAVLQAAAIRAYEGGDYETAAKDFGELLELHPLDYNVRHSLAFSLYDCGRPEEALVHAWIGLHGTTPDGRERFPATDSFYRKRPAKAFLLGLILEALGEPERAREHYELALQLNPAHANAAAALARLDARGR